MRLFIAIPIDESVRKTLSKLKFEDKNLRWVPAENLHITLQYVGNLKQSVAENLASELGQITFSSFQLSVQNIGTFPQSDNPAVLWAGVEAPRKLWALQQKVANVTEKNGGEPDHREYNPHITLAKVKSSYADSKQLQLFLKNWQQKFGSMRADCFILYKSILNENGAIHVEYKEYRSMDY